MTFADVVFVAYAVLLQGLMLANFGVRLWRPELERRYGPALYAFGMTGVVVAVALTGAGGAWFHSLGPLLYAAWSGWGYWVDVRKRVQWRTNPRSLVFLAYVGLFMAWQFAFWIPLWTISMAAWIAYAVMYACSTGLNLASHRRRPAAPAGEE
ncbi:MAG TPA: hypothetical protein VLL77_05610 [Anaerolineales bacterium]|nr:hypothetical protein [Anaerolineales bacterium]